MAYDASTDYRAIQNALKKQMEETTDEQEQAQLQSQWDAAEQSRTEKLASNLSQYGKWASDSELDSAAGVMAQNQIGTGFETQKSNLNKSYDQAKQNASNEALSRGMARSSFVQDRSANLDSERANSLSNIDASKTLALQNAKTNIIDKYQANEANKLANQKNEFAQNPRRILQRLSARNQQHTGQRRPVRRLESTVPTGGEKSEDTRQCRA